jgi:hypothetical protein
VVNKNNKRPAWIGAFIVSITNQIKSKESGGAGDEGGQRQRSPYKHFTHFLRNVNNQFHFAY